MELTGINLLLIIFAPVAFLYIFMIIMAPLINKTFDKHKPIEHEIKTKDKQIEHRIEEIINKLKEDSEHLNNDKIERYRAEIQNLRIHRMQFVTDRLKKIYKIRREESGYDDVLREIKEIKPTDSNGSAMWYLGSLLLTPAALLITGLLFYEFIESSYQSNQYSQYLIWPIIGLGLGYKGYKVYKKWLALMICLSLNTIYAIFITYGVLTLSIKH